MAGLQVLCSVAGADERTAPNLTTPQLQWLAETNFMAGLVAQLQSEGNSDAGSNARTVLVGVARSPLSAPLLQPLLDPSFFQPLLDSAFAAPVSVQVALAAPWSLSFEEPSSSQVIECTPVPSGHSCRALNFRSAYRTQVHVCGHTMRLDQGCDQH